MAILARKAVNQAACESSSFGRPRFWAVCLAVVGVMMSVALWARGAAPAAREYDVKATLLFNFCQFVEWPARVLSDPEAPFVIGILGEDPFGKFLDDLVRSERAYGKPVQIKRFRRPEEAQSAQILFISKSEFPKLGAILAVLKNKPILTVGDGGEDRSFTRMGGMIALSTERGNIHIRINLDEARSAGLSISAKLLHLAEIVRTEKG